MRTAKELMTTFLPKAMSDETAGCALEKLRESKPEEASHLYLVMASGPVATVLQDLLSMAIYL